MLVLADAMAIMQSMILCLKGMHCRFAKLRVDVFPGEAFEQELGRERGQRRQLLNRLRKAPEVGRQQ